MPVNLWLQGIRQRLREDAGAGYAWVDGKSFPNVKEPMMNSGLLLLVGVVLLLLGLAMLAGWFDWLLRVGGVILIIIGIIGIIVGLFNVFSGRNRSTGRF